MKKRRLPWIAALAFFTAAVMWIVRDPRIPHEAFQPYSVHNFSPKGLSLARNFLERGSGKPVALLDHPIDAVNVLPNGVVFRIRPDVMPAFQHMEAETGKPKPAPRLLTETEEVWVRNGGRLILAIDRSRPTVDVKESGPDGDRKVFPVWPGVDKLAPPVTRFMKETTGFPSIALFETDAGVAMSRIRIGQGELFLMSEPEIFLNEHLGKEEHLPLLIYLADNGRPVYFDEFVHGMVSKTGILMLLRAWGFGPLLLLLVGVGGVVYWRRRMRIGPEEDDYRETRIEALDFVDSLAILYNRALNRSQSVALYRAAFKRAVSIQTGAKDGPLEAKVVQLLGMTVPAHTGRDREIGVHEFQKCLTAINTAFRRLEDAKRPGNQRTVEATVRRT